jgi:CheY-like chemotaxis protein
MLSEGVLQRLRRARFRMPGEDGFTLVRKLRSMDGDVAKTPAAALTALARYEDRQQALDAGFQLHLAKPIDSQSLLAAVAGLAGLAKRAGQARIAG